MFCGLQNWIGMTFIEASGSPGERRFSEKLGSDIRACAIGGYVCSGCQIQF